MLYKVVPEQLDAIWPHVEPLLQGIYERDGRTSVNDFRAGFESGVSQLWVTTDADDQTVAGILVTSLIQHADFLACRLTHCTGAQRKQWLHLLEYIEDWARDKGCKRMEAFARPGWARDLETYRKTHVILEKAL